MYQWRIQGESGDEFPLDQKIIEFARLKKEGKKTVVTNICCSHVPPSYPGGYAPEIHAQEE